VVLATPVGHLPLNGPDQFQSHLPGRSARWWSFSQKRCVAWTASTRSYAGYEVLRPLPVAAARLPLRPPLCTRASFPGLCPTSLATADFKALP